uniref:Uncharacterized protein n=1 Tax=Haemonchus contortus TaxID=6289 RepID=A0A7I4YPK1_HAECO|nr:unnamed protein product [Haemonchus contortus]
MTADDRYECREGNSLIIAPLTRARRSNPPPMPRHPCTITRNSGSRTIGSIQTNRLRKLIQNLRVNLLICTFTCRLHIFSNFICSSMIRST